MGISFRITTKRRGPGYRPIGKQARYALMLSLNRTAEDLRAAQREGVEQRFIVRERRFIMGMVRRLAGDRATKEQLRARVRIQGPESAVQGPVKGALLTAHEQGGTFTPVQMGEQLWARNLSAYFWVPTKELRHNPRMKIPRRMYPSMLGLTDRVGIENAVREAKRHTTRTGAVQVKGKRRTFMMVSRAGKVFGIYQRFGKHRDDTQKIWYPARTKTLRPRLRFTDTSRRTYETRLPVHFRGAFEHALRTAR